MKKTIPSFIIELSDDDFTKLEEIFDYKYRRFLNVYWLIRDYSDQISSLEYSDNNKGDYSLIFNITFDEKSDLKEVVKQINKSISEGEDDIKLSKRKNVLTISLNQDEPEVFMCDLMKEKELLKKELEESQVEIEEES